MVVNEDEFRDGLVKEIRGYLYWTFLDDGDLKDAVKDHVLIGEDLDADEFKWFEQHWDELYKEALEALKWA